MSSFPARGVLVAVVGLGAPVLILLGGIDCGSRAEPREDAAPDACTSPKGFRVCNSDACPRDCGCPGCICLPPDLADKEIGVCLNDAGEAAFHPTRLCRDAIDGELCVARLPGIGPNAAPYTYGAADFELGALVALNGAAHLVRYADLGLWRDAPLPEPSECPEMEGALPCGGKCGACRPDEYCHGRSPLHPTGICVPISASLCPSRINYPACPLGSGCFIYRVEPEAQREADEEGFCFPLEQCRALAERLPGGGRCDEAPVDAGDGG